MKIAIVGPGAIGSTFAFQLAHAGHDVTVVARGTRLAQLQRDQAIEHVAGPRAAVRVRAALDTTTAWDLVLVTVLAAQAGPLLPVLQASAAKTVLFMFNTFESFGPLRAVVGPARFAFGFPAILASLTDGKVQFKVYKYPQSTMVTDPVWAQVFTDAGIPTVVHDDIESWLRTHAAAVAPLMALSVVVHARRAGVSWAEATAYARALRAGLTLVRWLGNPITPSGLGLLRWLPTWLVAALLWGLSRLPFTRALGAAGPAEPRMLIDAMQAAAPHHSTVVRAIRP